MRQTNLFPKTRKETPSDAKSVNHKYLVQAGYVNQLMAGSWSLLPLGWRVVRNITQIIREEMNAIGGQEILMPLLHPKEIWNETGRWEKAKEVMYQFEDLRHKEYALSFTHEEIFLDIIRKNIESYQDLPIALYHFSTKFRNEPRARSGVLRGREFLMKDMYSVHATKEDFDRFYESVKKAYLKAFKRMGFEVRVTTAAGGVFTENYTHEFQVLAEGGEDTIYYCTQCDWSWNKEIFEKEKYNSCPECDGEIKKSNSIEVGNIFPFGTSYSEKMNVTYVDKSGKSKYVWFGSYGIGTTRVMGAWVEANHDKKGIIWNSQLSPFDCHLIELPGAKEVELTYSKLVDQGLDVLWDDRDIGAGEKFTDSELIGIPNRLVVSEKTKDKIEYKIRGEDKEKLYSRQDIVKLLKDKKTK
jgi:prolyl-tRNA synthetase